MHRLCCWPGRRRQQRFRLHVTFAARGRECAVPPHLHHGDDVERWEEPQPPVQPRHPEGCAAGGCESLQTVISSGWCRASLCSDVVARRGRAMLLYCRSAAPRLLLSFCCCCRSAAAAVVLPLYCCCRCRSAAAVLLLPFWCCCRSAAAAVVLPLCCCCRCRSAAAVLLLPFCCCRPATR